MTPTFLQVANGSTSPPHRSRITVLQLQNKPELLARIEPVETARPAVKVDGSAEACPAPCDYGPQSWTQPHVLSLLELLTTCQDGSPADTIAERLRLDSR